MVTETAQPEKGSAKRIGYIRVSTHEQRPDRQIDGLKALCDELHIEQGVSAVAKKRPVFERVLLDLAEGDSLVVWNLDRAFRSSLDAIQTVEKLQARGVQLNIMSLNVDTATPEGRFVYTIMAGLAEMERATLARRTREGLASARLRGIRLGRPRILSAQDILVARGLLEDSSVTVASVATRFQCHPRTLARAMDDQASYAKNDGLISIS
jgi:DNA invertase Pin-like site-specific DNA recombinase